MEWVIMNELTKWVMVEHGVKTLKEFMETFTVEEVMFNTVVYREFNLETMSTEDTIEIQEDSLTVTEYRVHHVDTGDSLDTDYIDLEELWTALELGR